MSLIDVFGSYVSIGKNNLLKLRLKYFDLTKTVTYEKAITKDIKMILLQP